MTIILMFVPLIVAPSLGFLFTATLYSSFWAPQIGRSARRGRSSGLSREYIVGTTVCRLLLALCEYQRVRSYLGLTLRFRFLGMPEECA